MARFVYRMQNILELTEKLETQEKINFSIAQQAVNAEQDKLKELLDKRTQYDDRLAELVKGNIDFAEIEHCKQAITIMKVKIRDQMLALQKAQRNLERARQRLNEVMKDRKTHENLRDKAFEEFKKELAAEENKATDELVSYTYHDGNGDEE